MSKKKSLRLIPLGGIGEIGRNMMVYEYNKEILVVDTGLLFPENDMLGVDYIIPDIQYLRQRRQQIRGIVITHGHEDHIGAIHHVLEEIQVPVYATPMTRGLLEVKLARHGLVQKCELNTVSAGETVQIGPFRVEFFHVCHSIPDGVGLGIDTPAGLVVHSGDYKFDHTPVDNWPSDFAKLAEFSRRNVLALLSDSTNAEVPGWTPSEAEIDKAFDQVFSEAPGRIIIASFASLVSRMQQVVNAAKNYNRKVAFVGTSMVDNVKITRKLGYLSIPDSLMVPIDQALSMKDNQIVLMCTGAQGEPNSILGRLSTGTNRHFDIKPGDTVVLSSQAIPGNEEPVNRTINRLFERGANVIYEAIAPVHVSGHPSQEEIKLMINLVRPKYFLPIHGEQRHLKQAALLAEQVGIPAENIIIAENGQAIEFKDRKMKLAERVPYSYIFVDGAVVGDISPDVMREREIIGQAGIIIINLVIDTQNNSIVGEPSINSYGFMASQDIDSILKQIKDKILEIVDEEPENLKKKVEQATKTYIYSEFRRRPKIFVNITEI